MKIFIPLLLLLFQNITKRNELLIHETRINLKHIMLRDRLKKMLLLDSMYVAFYKSKIIGTENRPEVVRGWACKKGLTIKGDKGMFW